MRIISLNEKSRTPSFCVGQFSMPSHMSSVGYTYTSHLAVPGTIVLGIANAPVAMGSSHWLCSSLSSSYLSAIHTFTSPEGSLHCWNVGLFLNFPSLFLLLQSLIDAHDSAISTLSETSDFSPTTSATSQTASMSVCFSMSHPVPVLLFSFLF